MEIYDISQEVFGCWVYPGDPLPQKKTLCSTENGDLYNLTVFSMCAHNGTHIDAPYHFLNGGKTVDKLELKKTVGFCVVISYDGTVKADIAFDILKKARTISNDGAKRILIKGDAIITEDAAEIFAEEGILLVGVESQSVGPADAPMKVHKILLSAEIVLLEGICLENVPDGTYLLSAAPLNLSGADGSPCRAILIKL